MEEGLAFSGVKEVGSGSVVGLGLCCWPLDGRWVQREGGMVGKGLILLRLGFLGECHLAMGMIHDKVSIGCRREIRIRGRVDARAIRQLALHDSSGEAHS